MHLDQPAQLHDGDAVAEMGDDRQIVADEDAGEAGSSAAAATGD